MKQTTLLEIRTHFFRLAQSIAKIDLDSEDTKAAGDQLRERTLQAAKLSINAIDRGAFPREFAKQYGEWWDRKSGRIPGWAVTVYGYTPPDLWMIDRLGWTRYNHMGSITEAERCAVEKFIDDLVNLSQEWQFQNLWGATVAWLQRLSPHRIRHADVEVFRLHLEGPAKQQEEDHSKRLGMTRRGKTISASALRAVEVCRKSTLRRQAEASADACRLLADLIAESRDETERRRESAFYAGKKAKRIGRSMMKLLGWIWMCRNNGINYDYAICRVPASEIGWRFANVDVGGRGWRVVVEHVVGATGFHEGELEEIAEFVHGNCVVGSPDVREKYNRLQEKLNLPENQGLIDLILPELDEKCPGLADDIPRSIQTAIKVIEHEGPPPFSNSTAPPLVGREPTQEGRIVELRPRYKRAWNQYTRAIEANPALKDATNQRVYDYFVEHVCEEDEDLPEFDAWARYVTGARGQLGKQKRPRRVPQRSRSALRYDQF